MDKISCKRTSNISSRSTSKKKNTEIFPVYKLISKYQSEKNSDKAENNLISKKSKMNNYVDQKIKIAKTSQYLNSLATQVFFDKKSLFQNKDSKLVHVIPRLTPSQIKIKSPPKGYK